MNPKTTAILLIVFVLAIVALMLTDGTFGPSDDHDPGHSANGTTPDGDEDFAVFSAQAAKGYLKHLALNTDPDQPGVEIEISLKKGRWHIEHPHPFTARQTALDEVLLTIVSLKGRPAEERSFEETDQTRGMLLTINEDNVYSITLGPRLGAGRALVAIYPMFDRTNELGTGGNQRIIYNTDDSLHDLFDNIDVSLFYGSVIPTPLLPEVDRIEISLPGSTAVLTQRDNTWWIGQGETGERALEDALDQQQPGVSTFFHLLSQLDLKERQHYVGKDGLAAFGLTKPVIRMRFVPIKEAGSETSSGLEIMVGVPADPQDQTRFVGISIDGKPPAVFKGATRTALLLSLETTAFRDPRVITVAPTLIQSIALKPAEGATSTIVVDDDGAKLKAGDQSTALSELKRDELLFDLANARASAYVPTELGEWESIVSALVTPRLGGKPEPFTIYTDPKSDASSPTVLIHRGKESMALRIQRKSVAGLIDPQLLLTP